MQKKITKKDSKKGFTLVETLVAISILMLAITGPLYFASESIKAATYARDQITAFYLAQDAFEQIRAIRDNNLLGNTPWLTNISEPCGTACKVDPFGGSLELKPTACDVGGCGPIKLGSNGEYGYYSSWIPTAFTRTITVIQTGGDTDEAKVTVTLNWKSGSVPRNVTFYEYIRNLNPSSTQP